MSSGVRKHWSDEDTTHGDLIRNVKKADNRWKWILGIVICVIMILIVLTVGLGVGLTQRFERIPPKYVEWAY